MRREAVECEGCRWRLTPSCGTADDTGCLGSTTTCPPGEYRYNVLRIRPDEPSWRNVGTVCLGPNTPRTPADLVPEVRDRFVELLPTARPTFQPATGALVNLPTVFAANQPGSIGDKTFDLGRYEIGLTASASWTWSFGDGTTVTTQRPGGPWPDTSVSHTYTRVAARPVTVTTTWQGQFTVDGLGPFEVSGPAVTQTAGPLTVDVREARSTLVAD